MEPSWPESQPAGNREVSSPGLWTAGLQTCPVCWSAVHCQGCRFARGVDHEVKSVLPGSVISLSITPSLPHSGWAERGLRRQDTRVLSGGQSLQRGGDQCCPHCEDLFHLLLQPPPGRTVEDDDGLHPLYPASQLWGEARVKVPSPTHEGRLSVPAWGWGQPWARQLWKGVESSDDQGVGSQRIDSWASQVPRGKEPACQCRRHRRCGLCPWVRKIPRGRKWQPPPVFLPGEPHGQRSLVGYSPWGSQRVGHDWAWM